MASAHVDPQLVAGTWLHSREEDTAEQAVYRPLSFDYPPARATRPGYEFQADGACTLLGPSPRDGWSRQRGTWTFEAGDPPAIVIRQEDGSERRLRIAELARERLVLLKPVA